ncbi:MAG: hypothetical protein MJB14_23270 [Spirochaetes bacterium]|nr:hypothetical protein [Spirochaetota bacterium]
MESDIKILGHRGYSAKYPENTQLAFQKALEFGADGIELDIQKTSDGKYVVIHDITTGRTGKTDIHIAESTYEQLKTIDLGNQQTILTLEDCLKKFSDQTFLNIELKEDTLTPKDSSKIKSILKKYPFENILISSFKPELLTSYQKSNIPFGLLIGRETKEQSLFSRLVKVFQIKPNYINLPINIFYIYPHWLCYTIIKFFKFLRKKIVFWTVNRKTEMHWIVDWADIIITNEVEKMIHWVNHAKNSTNDND